MIFLLVRINSVAQNILKTLLKKNTKCFPEKHPACLPGNSRKLSRCPENKNIFLEFHNGHLEVKLAFYCKYFRIQFKEIKSLKLVKIVTFPAIPDRWIWNWKFMDLVHFLLLVPA